LNDELDDITPPEALNDGPVDNVYITGGNLGGRLIGLYPLRFLTAILLV
jgi:hypothetical protein